MEVILHLVKVGCKKKETSQTTKPQIGAMVLMQGTK